MPNIRYLGYDAPAIDNFCGVAYIGSFWAFSVIWQKGNGVDANDDPASWDLIGPSGEIGLGPISISADIGQVSVSLDSDDWEIKAGISASLFELTIPILRADIPTELLFGPIGSLLQGTLNGQDFLSQMYAAATSFFMPPRNVNLLGLEMV